MPGLKEMDTGRRSLAPASMAKRSSKRCSSSASSGTTSALAGGESTRNAEPERTGTRVLFKTAGAWSCIAISRVVPEPPNNPSADPLDFTRSRRVEVTHDEFDRGVFVEPDRHTEAAESPWVHDVIELDVGIQRAVVDRNDPLQAGRLDLPEMSELVGKLGEIFEQPAVLWPQFEARQHYLTAGLGRVGEAGFVKVFVVARQAAIRTEARRTRHLELRHGADDSSFHRPTLLILRAGRAPVGVPDAPSVLNPCREMCSSPWNSETSVICIRIARRRLETPDSEFLRPARRRPPGKCVRQNRG